jgi:hypothetical protein
MKKIMGNVAKAGVAAGTLTAYTSFLLKMWG